MLAFGLLPRPRHRANRDKGVRIAGTVLAYKSMSNCSREIGVHYADNRLIAVARDMGDQVG
jgi:hypothetical protein